MPALYTRPVKWLGVVLPVVLAVGAAAQAPDRAQTEALARRVNERMRALQREAERLAGEARTLVGDLRKLEIERDLQAERLAEAEAAVAGSQMALQQTTARLAELEQQRAAQAAGPAGAARRPLQARARRICAAAARS